MLLEKLCNACGASGDEGAVRKIIVDEIKDRADIIDFDYLGNVVALKNGRDHTKKIMLSAHMDEVGFIASKITDTGYVKFKAVGGIDTRVILGKKVVFSNGTKGIIGVKAIHLLSEGERESVPKIKDLYIDIGAKSADDAKKHIEIGDYAVFDTTFGKLGGNKFKAKAIDDRAGCAVLAEILKVKPEYDTYVCFTVQEEVGLRGSRICAERLKPDAALVLESTTCSDVYKTKKSQQVTASGGGVALSFMDSASITNTALLKKLVICAEANNIPVQLKKTTMGGNDAGSIHLAAGGVLTASASVPCRYLHSPVGVADFSDVKALYDFTKMYLSEIGGILGWNS